MSDETAHDDVDDEFTDPLADQIVLVLALAIPSFIGFAFWTRDADPLNAILSAFAAGLAAFAYQQRARPEKLNHTAAWSAVLSHPFARSIAVVLGGVGLGYGVVVGMSHPRSLILSVGIIAVMAGAIALLFWRSLY